MSNISANSVVRTIVALLMILLVPGGVIVIAYWWLRERQHFQKLREAFYGEDLIR